MITVHHLENSRSQRVLWLLEELQVPYEIKRYARNPQTMLAPPELAKVHPLGKSPVLEDNGTVVAESGAITEYLLDRYGNGRLRPAVDTPEYLRYRYWLHYAEGSAMTPLLLGLVFRRLPGRVPGLLRPLVRKVAERTLHDYVYPQIATHLDFMEAELTRSAWFAGAEFSAADIQMSFPVEGAEAAHQIGPFRPKLVEFLMRIHDRPAYQRALDKGGPYDLGQRL